MLTSEWQKSSRSSGGANSQCVEARQVHLAAQGGWRKSSRSNTSPTGNCVEVRSGTEVVQVRDSKLGDASPILDASPADWRSFLAAVAK